MSISVNKKWQNSICGHCARRTDFSSTQVKSDLSKMSCLPSLSSILKALFSCEDLQALSCNLYARKTCKVGVSIRPFRS